MQSSEVVDANMAMERTFDAMMAADASGKSIDAKSIATLNSGCAAWDRYTVHGLVAC